MNVDMKDAITNIISEKVLVDGNGQSIAHNLVVNRRITDENLDICIINSRGYKTEISDYFNSMVIDIADEEVICRKIQRTEIVRGEDNIPKGVFYYPGFEGSWIRVFCHKGRILFSTLRTIWTAESLEDYANTSKISLFTPSDEVMFLYKFLRGHKIKFFDRMKSDEMKNFIHEFIVVSKNTCKLMTYPLPEGNTFIVYFASFKREHESKSRPLGEINKVSVHNCFKFLFPNMIPVNITDIIRNKKKFSKNLILLRVDPITDMNEIKSLSEKSHSFFLSSKFDISEGDYKTPVTTGVCNLTFKKHHSPSFDERWGLIGDHVSYLHSFMHVLKDLPLDNYSRVDRLRRMENFRKFPQYHFDVHNIQSIKDKMTSGRVFSISFTKYSDEELMHEYSPVIIKNTWVHFYHKIPSHNRNQAISLYDDFILLCKKYHKATKLTMEETLNTKIDITKTIMEIEEKYENMKKEGESIQKIRNNMKLDIGKIIFCEKKIAEVEKKFSEEFNKFFKKSRENFIAILMTSLSRNRTFRPNNEGIKRVIRSVNRYPLDFKFIKLSEEVR